MKSTRALEWAYNRCNNERAKALAKADDLDWYLRNYNYWRSQKRDRDRDYRHWRWYRDEADRLQHFAGVV
eukprot:9982626-Alexandrium_andersonii.AAC.1